tara:strand:+ start:13188 stop:13343 length:156 start_codon:yes stop_codon:yes gene_type:complete
MIPAILSFAVFDTVVTGSGLGAGVVTNLRDRSITVIVADDNSSTHPEGDAE